MSNLQFALQALKHPYFSNRPAPAPGPQLPRPGQKNEQEKVSGTSNMLKRKIDEPFGTGIYKFACVDLMCNYAVYYQSHEMKICKKYFFLF